MGKVLSCIRCHYESRNVNFFRLKVCGEILENSIPLFARRHTVVALEWKCADQDLTAIRRVG